MSSLGLIFQQAMEHNAAACVPPPAPVPAPQIVPDPPPSFDIEALVREAEGWLAEGDDLSEASVEQSVRFRDAAAEGARGSSFGGADMPFAQLPAASAPAERAASPDMLHHALAAARRGIRVLPIPANSKSPALDGWQRRATTDEATIRAWAEEFPGCNWGGITGCVIDFDVKHGKRGAAMFALFRALFPDTYTQRSASGGYHMFFKPPDDAPPLTNSNGRMVAQFGPDCGIDVRGAGGQVVLAGSTINGAPYTVLDDLPIAEAPPDLLALCGRRRERAKGAAGEGVLADHPADVARAAAWLRDEAPEARENVLGDDTTYRVAARVRGLGISEGECLALMLEHWNERCAPPWSVEELEIKVGNAYRYATGVAGADGVAGQFGLEGDAADADVLQATGVSPDALGAPPPHVSPEQNLWPEPEDLWAEMLPPPQLPHGVFPKLLDRWARDAAYRLGGYDPGCIAMPALVALSGIVPASLQIQVKQHDTGHKERPILWGMLHGAPGAKKSPAIKIACEPLYRIQAQLDKENDRRRAQYNDAVTRWKKPGGSGEQRTAENAPTRPRHRAVMVNDATVEALAPVLADNPGGLACVRDELAGWIGGFDAYRQKGAGSKDREFWLGAKQGQPYSVIRVSREPVHVPSVAVSMLGGMQPEVLRQHYAGLASDGILQRFLIVHIDRQSDDIDQAPDTAAENAIHAAAENLHALRSLSDFVDTFRFAPPADIVRRELLGEANQWLSELDLPSGLREWVSKLEGEWARIALLFHLIEWASSPGASDLPIEPPLPVIGEHTARAAARFLLDYALPHRWYVERSAEGSRGEGSDTVWIAGYVLADERKEIRERDLYTNYRPIRRLTGPARQARVQKAMAALCTAGWAAPVEGRHPHWTINPAVHARFARKAADERARRTSIKVRIKADAAERAAGRATPAEPD